MSATNTLGGGGFQDILGNPVANGYLTLELSQSAAVNTNNINSPRSVETAGLGHKEGSGFHSTSSIGFA